MVKEQLIQFETEIGDSFNRGEIKAPIHLYSGNEDLMIELFKEIDIEELKANANSIVFDTKGILDRKMVNGRL
jgi:hypothetical protein